MDLRLVLLIAALVLLLGAIGYATLVGIVGSRALMHPPAWPDRRTPLDRFGWAYKAINYDIADDSAAPNPRAATAGTDVVTSDGIHIAGWYIPAANGAGPTGTTVVLVHGWSTNKSDVIKYAVPFHAAFNVVAFDLRNSGQSSRTVSTFGLRESLDLEAVIDWLERTKHPAHIAVMGCSVGGAASVLAAVRDRRIEALILDSTHARVQDLIGRRLRVDEGQPSWPGTPSVLFWTWLRTRLDLRDSNPIDTIPKLGRRPVLLIHGASDQLDLPADSVQANYRAAQAAGVPVELHICEGGTHGMVIEACPDAWARWSVEFLDRVFG